MKTFGTKDLAAKIRREGESEESAINRLKSWVREGLFYHHMEEDEPGTGRARRYHEAALVDAFLYETFTRCLKAPASAFKSEMMLLRHAFMKNAKRDADFLVLGYSASKPTGQVSSARVKARDLGKSVSDMGDEIFIVLDIQQVLNRLHEED